MACRLPEFGSTINVRVSTNLGSNHPYQATDTRQNYNADDTIVPLRLSDNPSKSEWWTRFHDFPPAAGARFKINSGGKSRAELGSNRARTTMRHPGATGPYYASYNGQTVDGAIIGYPQGQMNAHNGMMRSGAVAPLNRTMFGGTAIAIAYNSDEKAVQPEDFTVISVHRMSPWNRLVDYEFPAGMPPCPSGGCLCTWNWSHTRRFGAGYGDEILLNLFRCDVVGNTNANNDIPKGKAPVFCTNGNAYRQGNCVTGPKQPLYAFLDGHNVAMPAYWGAESPIYSPEWGFADGAQHDAVVKK